MTKWIVVFQVTSCYDTASLWPGWISVQRDLLSGDWMTALPILHDSSLVGWLPLLPGITYFSSEKQLPPITGPNSIRQGLVLKVLVSFSSWCADSGCVWKSWWGSCDDIIWVLISVQPGCSVAFTPPVSLQPPTSSIAQNGHNRAVSWFTVLVSYYEAIWFPQMPGNPNAVPGHAFEVEFALQGPLFFFSKTT